ncbi:MAG: phosphatidate cytidylyltransferase [Pirellulales bacterium]
MSSLAKMFDPSLMFDRPITALLTGSVVAALIATSILVRVLHVLGKTSDKLHSELIARLRSWYLLSVCILAPILMGRMTTWFFLAVLSFLCLRELSKAVGLDRFRWALTGTIIANATIWFAVIEPWYGLFLAAVPLGIALIAVLELFQDQPAGYLKRVSLGALALFLVGSSLGHLGWLSNQDGYRSILMWIILMTELNDVFAFTCGKTFGRRKLIPATSPNKTIGGAVGALVLTTLLSIWVGSYVFAGTKLAEWHHLLVMGLMLSFFGQCGDLVMSSIKRDIGIKDMADTIPGHGGFLDRFDSLLITAPALFYYMRLFGSVW